MTWQAYVDSSIMEKGFLAGAISGADGSLWAASADFSLGTNEQSVLAPDVDFASLLHQDFFISGVGYKAFHVSERSLYGKAINDQNGCVVVRTTQAIVIGVYDAALTPSSAAIIIEGLADYFINLGY